MPSNVGRFNNDSVDITCKLCNLNVTGDEYHYIFVCNAFDTQRDYLLSFNFTSNHRSSKMSDLFNSKDTLTLLKASKIHQNYKLQIPIIQMFFIYYLLYLSFILYMVFIVYYNFINFFFKCATNYLYSYVLPLIVVLFLL